MRFLYRVLLCLIICQTGLSSSEPALQAGSDEGVSRSMNDLEKHLGPRSGKQIPAESAEDTALSIELSVRNVTSQVKRFKAYFKGYPDEVTNGRAAVLFTQAHKVTVRLESVSKSTISHADRILLFAREIDLAIPAVTGEVATVGN